MRQAGPAGGGGQRVWRRGALPPPTPLHKAGSGPGAGRTGPHVPAWGPPWPSGQHLGCSPSPAGAHSCPGPRSATRRAGSHRGAPRGLSERAAGAQGPVAVMGPRPLPPGAALSGPHSARAAGPAALGVWVTRATQLPESRLPSREEARVHARVHVAMRMRARVAMCVSAVACVCGHVWSRARVWPRHARVCVESPGLPGRSCGLRGPAAWQLDALRPGPQRPTPQLLPSALVASVTLL